MKIERDALYTSDDVCAMLGLSLRSLQRAVQRGELPARVVGAKLVFVGSDLLDHMARVPAGGRRKRKGAGSAEGGKAEGV